jgi:hypothetical protein
VNERGGADANFSLTRELALCESAEFPVENSKKLARASLVPLFRQVDQRRDVRFGRLQSIR